MKGPAMMGNGGSFDLGNMMNGGWNGGWPMLLLGVVIVVAIVLFVVWAVRASSRK